jgi:hypothetical protein
MAAPSVAGQAPSYGGYGEAAKASSPRADYEAREEGRPGLGTGWGENRYSPTQSASFVRESSSNPFMISSLYYNDHEGADAMARASDYRSYDRGWQPVQSGIVSISLRDESGRSFQGFYAGGRSYVIGEPGARYVIMLQNNSGYRFEAVATVDGLDVIDGQPGAFEKRGYILDPHATLEIDGFRRSDETVAAFRFSSVRGSYSAQSGQGDRNVGVIGLALFQERGQYPRWGEGEVQRRHDADPFPQRYAQPPRN